MSRKDFELIAATLRDSKPMNVKSANHVGWEGVVVQFLINLPSTNSNFDSERFAKACNFSKEGHRV